MSRLFLLGAESGPRLRACRQAAEQLGLKPVHIDYAGFLRAPEPLDRQLRAGDRIKIDSPHRQPEALAALLQAGREDSEAAGLMVCTDPNRPAWPAGRVLPPAQLAFGMARALALLEDIAGRRQAHLSTSRADLQRAYDKTRMQQAMQQQQLPTPEAVPTPADFAELEDTLRARRIPRVFIKLRHGAAAAAMMALALGPRAQLVAYTTACLVKGALYSTRRLRRLQQREAIAACYHAMARFGLHGERWLPKLTLAGRHSDVRVVCCLGQPPGAVVRSARSPMTNLHLGAERHALADLDAQVARATQQQALRDAQRAARLLPDTTACGVDLAFLSDGRRHSLFEVNLFGNFIRNLPGGMDPIRAELQALMAPHRQRA